MEEEIKKESFASLSDIFQAKPVKKVKAPAYEWQDFALRIIKDLAVPNFKRSSVFKICKDMPSSTVERALNDTKELCKSGDAWKYFFKVIDVSVKEQKEKK